MRHTAFLLPGSSSAVSLWVGTDPADTGWSVGAALGWPLASGLFRAIRLGWGWDSGLPFRPWPTVSRGADTRVRVGTVRTEARYAWFGFFCITSVDVRQHRAPEETDGQ